MQIEKIQSTESSVCKFVYTADDYVAESVLYKYPDYETRTVICCSTMSGCPMGCRFCGAGDYFVKNLTGDQIVAQVDHSIKETKVDPSKMERLQIMFMSMGEPLLNKKGLTSALRTLYKKYPNAALLISTSAPSVDMKWVNEISVEIPTIGLQFSIHESTDEARDKLIPFKKKMTLEEIVVAGYNWFVATGRKPFFNYCAHDDNSSIEDVERLSLLFSPDVWEATISVVCERNEGLPSRNDHQVSLAATFSEDMLNYGYNVRVFDPAGQDDIGGGCGQLWFVQNWMKNNPEKVRPSVGHEQPIIHVPGGVK
jgi:23S rRNA (adenine2503-C2)-methyltransferase